MPWRQLLRAGQPSPPAEEMQASSAADPPADLHWQQKLREAEAAAQRRAAAEYQRGFAEGEAAGVRKCTARVDGELERLARSMADLAGFRDRFRRESEEDLVNVALAIARRVLRRELAVDPEAVLGLVKVAMEKVSLRDVHRIRLHPDDLPVVKAHLERIQAPAAIQVEADPGLERGAVLFETSRGSLDVSIDTQLRHIERGFADIGKGEA
jgi:flagellar assembly protein FliH